MKQPVTGKISLQLRCTARTQICSQLRVVPEGLEKIATVINE